MKKITTFTYVPDGDAHFTQPIGAYQQAASAWFAADLAKYYSRGKVAVDIGAHIGHMSFVFAQRFDRVHAFEPVQDNLLCLRANLNQFTRGDNAVGFLDVIVTHQQALSDKDEPYQLNNPAEHNSGAWVVTTGEGELRTRTLDSYNFKDVGLIKIDVQGGEIAILKGAAETLARCKPILLVEIINEGKTDPVLEDLIESLGYKPFMYYTKQAIYLPTEVEVKKGDRRNA